MHHPAVFIESHVVGGHDHVHRGVQGLLQLPEGLPVRFQKHVVRIQPQAVVHGRPVEGRVPGLGKIVPPGEVADMLRKPGRDLPGAVRGTGVHDDDLIHQVRRALQAPGQDVFLIFYDHAQAYRRHCRSSSYWMIAILCPVRRRGEKIRG